MIRPSTTIDRCCCPRTPPNPTQVASRMVDCFSSWRQFDKERQAMMKAQLDAILGTKGISENVHELVSKALA